MTTDPESDDDLAESLEPSKSQRKRDALEVRGLAEQLVGLSSQKRANLRLSPELENAVEQCPPTRMRGARKRHLQFISKLLRNTSDPELLKERLEDPDGPKPDTRHHESMRDRLMESFTDNADELRANYPSIDLQQTRQLIRKAIAEKNDDTGPIPNQTSDDSHTTNPQPTTKRDGASSRSLLQLLIRNY